MLAVGSPVTTQLAASALAPVLLFEFDFVQGTQYTSTWNDKLTIGGLDYIPLGGAIGVTNFGESEDNSVEQLTVTLPLVNLALLSLVTGGVENYRGRQGRIYLQVLDANAVPVGSKILRYAGYMEPVHIKRDASSETAGGSPLGVQGTIEMKLSRAGLVRSRNYEGLSVTDQQQKLRYPGDNSFEYVKSLLDAPTQWLSIRFQKQ